MDNYVNIGTAILDKLEGQSVKKIIKKNMSKSKLDLLIKKCMRIKLTTNDFDLHDIHYHFIMSIILWHKLPLESIISHDSEIFINNKDDIINCFSLMVSSLKKDAFIEYIYYRGWTKEDNQNTYKSQLSEIISNNISDEYSLIYPVEIILEIKNFAKFYNSLSIDSEFISELFPALFIQWLNTYNPDSNKVIESEPYYMLLLTLLFPPRQDDELTQKKSFESRLIDRIFDAFWKENKCSNNDGGNCNHDYEELYGVNCNEECNQCEVKMVKTYQRRLSKLPTPDKNKNVSTPNIEEDEGYEDIAYESLTQIKEEKDDAFWNVLTDFAKSKENKKVRNSICYKNIYLLKELIDHIPESKNNAYKLSKTLSLLHINKVTHWIDLILINMNLLMSETEINGLLTKRLLCEIHKNENIQEDDGLTITKHNYLNYNAGVDKLFEIQNDMHFLDGITIGINHIIKAIRLRMEDTDKRELNSIKGRYMQSYDELYNELINLKLLEKTLTKKSIVEYAYYLA